MKPLCPQHRKLYFEDLANPFKFLIKFELKISLYKYQILKDDLINMGLMCTLKEGKPCYTPMREICDAIRKLKPPKFMKDCRSFCRMVNIHHHFTNISDSDIQKIKQIQMNGRLSKNLWSYQIAAVYATGISHGNN